MPKLSNPGGRQARVALNAAKAAGVSVKLNGGKLSLKASGPPPGRELSDLAADTAKITTPDGGHLTFYRRTLEAGGVLVWELAAND